MSKPFSRCLALALLVTGLSGVTAAQTASLAGTVVDAESGETVPGVNVFITELELGAVTGLNGRYIIPNVTPRAEAYTVRASFTGYQTVEQTVVVAQAGQQATLNFRIRSGVGLNEVVVTALGIERQQRQLGYAVESISGNDVTAGDNSNLIASLSGRIAGVDITQSSGSIGSSTRLILRGVTSLSGDNQPLFVIDGVPISNANVAPTQGRLQGSVDTGNRANDINPADIESISVLKGGAAAALYGQRAKNGVILITTRRGVDRARASVQVSSSVVSNTVGRLPSFQNEYAPGTLGHYTSDSFSGWGPRIAGQTVSGSLTDRTTPFVLSAQPGNVRDFFETGISSTNNVSFSMGNQTTDFRLGVGYLSQGGITPNSRLDRYNVTLNTGTRLPNGFNARTNLNYITSNDQGRAIQGGNEDTIAGTIFAFPRTLSTQNLRSFRDEFGNQRTLGPTTNNPFWLANENLFTSDLNRVLGSGTIGFEATEWLNFTARVGTDFYTQNRRQVYRQGTLGAVQGRFRDDTIQEREINFDLFGQLSRPLAQDFTLQAIVGTNVNQRGLTRTTNDAQVLAVDEVFNFANAATNIPANGRSLRRLAGFFSDVTLGWQNAVFLNLTGRNDISSTLPVENRSYFYPSASLSAVFTDLVDLDARYLSYGKVRVNAARVGSDEAPYQLDFRYFPVNSVFGQFNTSITFPYFGNAAYTSTGTVPPSDLRPQQQTTYEIGLELGLLRDRVTVDLNYYDQVVDDQIITLPRPFSSGFGGLRTNVGTISNRGFEAVASGETFRMGGFSHSLRATYATNQNRVVALADGVPFVTLETGFNTIAVRAQEGESLGLYGTGWQRDEATGLPVINEVTGLRVLDNNPVRLGDLDPNFRAGFGNTFRYGPVSMSALLDWRSGGVLYSNTVANARGAGRAEETLLNRGGTIVDIGVIRNADGTTRPNDVPVQNMQSFWGHIFQGSVQESATFDASYVKLREVVVSYSVPQSILRRSPFGSATVAFEGRNLALLYSRIPHIDPETNLFGSGTVGGAGYEFNSLPATRQFGFNINASF